MDDDLTIPGPLRLEWRLRHNSWELWLGSVLAGRVVHGDGDLAPCRAYILLHNSNRPTYHPTETAARAALMAAVREALHAR